MQTPIKNKKVSLGGKIGELTDKITERWLLTILETNPAILDIIRDAGKEPLRVLMAWSGEFAGKYLTSAASICSLTGDEKLFKYLEVFVDKLCSLQKPDGYFGTWGEEYRFESESPVMHYVLEDPSDKKDVNWDTWNHYHIILGLLTWYDYTGDEKALLAAKRAAELICRTFYSDSGKKISDVASPETNMAIIHAMTLLYKITKEEKFLRFALDVADDFENAGDYIRCALNGTEFFKTPKPRWESLHSIEGIVGLFEITKDEKYKTAALRLWESMTKTDLHNTYGFSTAEEAKGSPFEKGAIETCCTVAYMALTADILRITGDARCADILEKCLLNSGIGSISPSGRWSTYDTPVEGYKRANYHVNGWQSRPGSPDLNCCSVNAPRAIGLLSDWAFTEEDGSLVINYYGDCRAPLTLSDGRQITVTEKTDYPYDGRIKITVSGAREKLEIKLRIPSWTKSAAVTADGKTQTAKAGYFTVGSCENIEIELDMTLRFTAGEGEWENRISVTRGPLLLCLDATLSDEFFPIPTVDPKDFKVSEIADAPLGGRIFKCESMQKELTLCDLYTAGVSGRVYTTWLTPPDAKPAPFSAKTLDRSFCIN